jgi:hypothetical protein
MTISVYNSYKPTLVRCDDTVGEMSLAIACNYISSRNFSYLKKNKNNNSLIKKYELYKHEWSMLQLPYICQGSLGPGFA